MPPAAQFWQDRAARHGHTGWGDQHLYAYDQIERLQFVTALLDEAVPCPAGGIALDFGCGTGDFSRLLLDRGLAVYGYDPFVAPAIDHPHFARVGDANAIVTSVPPVDLVLSVTVLDHIVDDDEFGDTIARIHDVLQPDGRLVMLEYAPEDSAEDGNQPRSRRSSYQAFRSFSEWRAVLAAGGFEIVDTGPVPHPIDSPSAGFIRYRRKLLVRTLRRLRVAHRRLPQRVLKDAARHTLEAAPSSFPHPAASPLRYMVCRKRTGTTR